MRRSEVTKITYSQRLDTSMNCFVLGVICAAGDGMVAGQDSEMKCVLSRMKVICITDDSRPIGLERNHRDNDLCEGSASELDIRIRCRGAAS